MTHIVQMNIQSKKRVYPSVSIPLDDVKKIFVLVNS